MDKVDQISPSVIPCVMKDELESHRITALKTAIRVLRLHDFMTTADQINTFLPKEFQ